MPMSGMRLGSDVSSKVWYLMWHMLSDLTLLQNVLCFRADIVHAAGRGRHGRQAGQTLLNATDAQAQPVQSFTHLHAPSAAPGQPLSGRLTDIQQHRSAAQQSTPKSDDESREARSRGVSPVRNPKRAGGDGWPGIRPGAVLEGHHKVQTWLGLGAFLSLEPASYSRRILNDQVKPICSSRCACMP